MNLYMITWPEAEGYDTYRAVVVAAPNADAALCMHPSGYDFASGAIIRDDRGRVIRAYFREPSGNWASSPMDLKIALLGRAVPGVPQGVIVADFRAA